jgi:hypothetical protein
MHRFLKLLAVATLAVMASGCIRTVQHYAGPARPDNETARISTFRLNVHSINGEPFTTKNAMTHFIDVIPGDYTIVASTSWDTPAGSTVTHRESAAKSIRFTAKPGMFYGLSPKEGPFYAFLGINFVEKPK